MHTHGKKWQENANKILIEAERLEKSDAAQKYDTVWRDKRHYKQLLGCSERTAFRYLEELVRMNHLRTRKGPHSWGSWYYMEYRLVEDWNPR